MRTAKIVTLCCLLALCPLLLFGCGKKADESKPLSEVQAEADKMDTSKLRSVALKYKDAIMDKKTEFIKLGDKLKEIPVAEMLGDEVKMLKSEIDNLSKSISALTERFQVYYQKLKKEGGDLSGLEI